MLKSMTGFARKELQADFGALTIEVKSVNHRFHEMSLKAPEELRPLEPQIRALVAKYVARGKVDLSIKFMPGSAAQSALAVDGVLLARLGKATQEIEADWPVATTALSMADLLRWPGVVKEAAQDLAPIHAAALELLESALHALVASRDSEGERLQHMLAERCVGISAQVAFVRERLPDVHKALLQRLRERVQALAIDVDEGRLEQEIALVAQKADVAEELDRLDSHVSETKAAFDVAEPVGRRLDFLMQEFNREANTLASKSQDTACSKAAVELKVMIEQMREQVQNVE